MDDQSSMSQAKYQYTPIQRPRSIRLLVLLPAASFETSPVKVLLGELSLDDCPNFSALSYTWTTEDGDASLSKCLECKGALINVTANCEAALRRIRQVEDAQLLWVDAICIDQSNDNEKSLQIPLMRQIYSRASLVVLWLGAESSTIDEKTSRPLTDLGMAFIRDFAIEICGRRKSGQNVREGILYQEVVEDQKAYRDQGIGAFTPPVRGLWEILHRQWWSRLWVVQELALARSAVLVCGSKFEAFANVEVVIDGLVRDHADRSVEEFEFCTTFVTATFPQYFMRDYVKRRELRSDRFENAGPGEKALEILNSTRNLRATDPRDKIYGILGLFGDPESDPQNIFPPPDYTKTVAELYSDVTRAIIVKTCNLDVLSTCYGFLRTVPDLPSWAPCWNATPIKYFSEQEFNAANDSSVIYEESGESQCLRVKGKRVDAVKHTNEIPGRLEYTDLECTRLWRQWSDLAFSLQSYPTGESIASALMHTLCFGNNVKHTRLVPGEYQETFNAWIKILKSADPLETVARDLFSDQTAYTYAHRASFITWARTLIVTSNSYLATVPVNVSPGDEIVILSGCRLPFVLRATGDKFKLVGPCYVHGIMDGEAFPKEGAGSEDLEWFTLC
jgi:hypothetical protein